MQARTWLLLFVALSVAAFTAYVVRGRLHQGNPASPASIAQTKILVAATAIPAGSFIRPDAHLSWSAWPAETVQASYITQAGHTLEEFSGAVARRAITAGEPITPNLLVKASEGGFMSAVLSPGARAVSIAVNATSGNAGFVFPGDRVDLIVTHSIPVEAMEGSPTQNVVVSETFVENVRVLAIDQMLDNPENKAVLAKTITLEVTPKQAEMVNVAADLGKISLSLRSLATEKKPGSPDTLLQNPFAEEAPANATSGNEVSKMLESGMKPSVPVNVIRGSASEKIQFNRGQSSQEGVR